MKFQRGVIQKGIWWQSAVRLDGETIVPAPPFHPYNVFDFYFPLERSTETRTTPSLCYEILSVDGRDPQAVLRFCERFGVPGRPHLELRIYSLIDVLTKAKDPFDRLATMETAPSMASSMESKIRIFFIHLMVDKPMDGRYCSFSGGASAFPVRLLVQGSWLLSHA